MKINIIDNLSGAQFEIFAKEFLNYLGFKNIEITKYQGDFGADLIGQLDGLRYVIQAKRSSKSINIKAVQEAYTSMRYYDATGCAVLSNNSFTNAAIILASRCNCKLIGRDDLVKWTNKEFASPQELLSYLQNKGLKYHRIPSEDLIKEYYKVKDQLNKQPTGEEIDVHGQFSYATYQKRWGSWDNFLQAVGGNLTYRRNRPVTKDELITDYRNVREKVGRIPNRNDLKHYGKHGLASYYRKFGSWNKFLTLMGETEIKRFNIPKQELIKEFYRVKKQIGHTPTIEEMEKHGNIHPSTYGKHWGSWGKFLKNLGENYREINIQDNDLIREYLRVRKLLKKDSLSTSDIDKYCRYSSPTYKRKFGGLSNLRKLINETKGT